MHDPGWIRGYTMRYPLAGCLKPPTEVIPSCSPLMGSTNVWCSGMVPYAQAQQQAIIQYHSEISFTTRVGHSVCPPYCPPIMWRVPYLKRSTY